MYYSINANLAEPNKLYSVFIKIILLFYFVFIKINIYNKNLTNIKIL
jgi:hypothetical protein